MRVKVRDEAVTWKGSFANAARAIAGIELVYRIRKAQFMLSRKRGPKPKEAWEIALA
jgi:hypothetical protein